MICREPGALPGSIYHFFTPSDNTKRLFYYPIWVGHYYCNSHYSIKRKSYPMMLALYVHAGDFFVETAGRTHHMTKGSLVLLDCHNPHHYYAGRYVEFTYLHFEGLNARELCRYLTEQNGILYTGLAAGAVAERLGRYIAAKNTGKSVSEFENSLLICDVLNELDSNNPARQNEDSAVGRALGYIDRHYAQPLTLDEIAGAAHVSKYHLSREFKARTGSSPWEYIVNARIDQAKFLLKNTAQSVEDIAFGVGYGSAVSFTNMFTKKVGQSPMQFRKMSV